MKIINSEKTYVLLLATIQFVHIVDFVILMPLGPVLMGVFDITPMQFGSLVSSYNFSAGVTSLIYGMMADKYDRKSSLLFCLVGFILTTFLCGLADSYSTLLWARIFTGGFGGALSAGVLAYVTDLIPFERRGKAMGSVMSAFSVASVLGVPLGLLVTEKFGWQYAFMSIAGVTLLVFVYGVFVLPSIPGKVERLKIAQHCHRLKTVLLRVDYLKSYIVIFINIISIFMLIPYLAPYAVKNMGILETQLKYMYFCGGFFTVISARIIGKSTDHFGTFKVLLVVIFVSLFPIYFYTHSGPLTLSMFLIMSTFFMMSVSGRMIPLITLTSEIPDPKDRGLYMGLFNSIRSVGSALATLLAGFVIAEDSLGQLTGFNTVGIVSLLLSIPIVWGAHHIYSRYLIPNQSAQ